MGNVRSGAPRLWVHFVSVLWKTGATLLLVDRARPAASESASHPPRNPLGTRFQHNEAVPPCRLRFPLAAPPGCLRHAAAADSALCARAPLTLCARAAVKGIAAHCAVQMPVPQRRCAPARALLAVRAGGGGGALRVRHRTK